jgi:hypothetical protein
MSRLAAIRSTILLGWLVMVALLLRFEAYPEYFTHTIDGYGSFLDRNVMIEDRWMKLLFKDKQIGYSFSSVEVTEGDPKKHYTIKNEVFVRFRGLGLDQPVYVNTLAHVDAFHVLRRFHFRLTSGAYKISILGRRLNEKEFSVSTVTGNRQEKRIVEIPDDVILYSPMTEMGLKSMKPGQEMTIKTLDPASMTPSTLIVRAVQREPFMHRGKEIEAMRLETDYQGVTIQSWMDRDGKLLKQETPFGWSMVSCSAEEAVLKKGKESFSGDILAELAIRCEGVIRNPRSAKGIRIMLSGVNVAPETLSSNRQRILNVGEEGIEMMINAAHSPDITDHTRIASTNLAPFLASTSFVQADHPDMKKAVRKIVGDLTSPAEKVNAIFDWVDKNVKNVMTVSLPSALDVLHGRQGDCNEHTYLFTGLARSAGIPAKIIVGVAYHEGAFYYHAWPAVYLGEWYEMDPTWGEKGVDATHIKIAEGELSDQMVLMKFVGQAKIKILEQL